MSLLSLFVVHVLNLLVRIKFVALVVHPRRRVLVVARRKLLLELLGLALTLVFDSRRVLAFGAFLFLALLVCLFTSVCLDLVDPLLEVEVARLTRIVVRYLVVVFDLVVLALHVLLVLTDLVHDGVRLLAIYDRVFFDNVRLLPAVVVLNSNILLDGLIDGATLMRQVWNVIFDDVCLLTIVLDSTYLILNAVSFLAFVVLLGFE